MIDLGKLLQASQGDQTKKVAVNKVWLKEIHSELCELERLRAEAAARSPYDKAFDKVFGKGKGSFGDIFNKDNF